MELTLEKIKSEVLQDKEMVQKKRQEELNEKILQWVKDKCYNMVKHNKAYAVFSFNSISDFGNVYVQKYNKVYYIRLFEEERGTAYNLIKASLGQGLYIKLLDKNNFIIYTEQIDFDSYSNKKAFQIYTMKILKTIFYIMQHKASREAIYYELNK